jgi:hypothetical protein
MSTPKSMFTPISIPMLVPKAQKSASLKSLTPIKLTKEQEEFAKQDPISIKDKCPENKQLNPNTNRCVIKCKDGYLRNDKFKCIKDKTQKVKVCVDTKEINPNTNRCVNKCKNGYLRNNKFKCAKNKTQKVCVDTKEINPNTNRCVNKCKNGYLRNNKFKCVKN